MLDFIGYLSELNEKNISLDFSEDLYFIVDRIYPPLLPKMGIRQRPIVKNELIIEH